MGRRLDFGYKLPEGACDWRVREESVLVMAARWHEVQRPGAVIHFLDTDGPGPAVVLLHGLAGYGAEWQATIEHLASSWRVLALDQRGHGRSTRSPGDLSRNAYADDVIAVLEATGVTEPVVLIGQSMGAHTAMWAATRAPGRIGRLVMIEGDVGGGGEVALAELRAALEGWPVPFAGRDAAITYFGGESEVSRAWVAGLEARPDGLWPRWDLEVMVQTMEPVMLEEAWPIWESVTQPTLIALGERGIIDGGRVRRMRELRPETRLVTIPDAGHDVHLDQTAAWLRELDLFLAET
jgi:pimeloyl-ACP methyl ester carboxylesterase